MPRDASNVYHVPPGSDGTPNTVISSARYNTLIHDLESDANNPRPIVAGGTGSSTPQTAIAALGAAPNNQIVIPNYASMTFITGFFNSDATVSDAPVTGHRFVGNASFINSTNGTLQCRDLDDISQPGRVYCREMNGGVWGPWTLREGVFAGTKALQPGVAVREAPGEHGFEIGLAKNVVEKRLIVFRDQSIAFGDVGGEGRVVDVEFSYVNLQIEFLDFL